MLSVIIPVYNVAPYLGVCIRSVLSQDYADFECILVDDGSTDGSGEICDSWGQKDSRIRVIHQTNQGVSVARNKGLDVAKGDYIAFVDSDDWIDGNYLSCLVTELEDSECDLSVIGVTSHYKDGTVLQSGYKDCRFKLSSGAYSDFIEMERLFLFFTPYNKLYRRDIVEIHKIRFKRDCSYGEDLLFNYDYLQYVDSIANRNVAAYHYRRLEANNLSSKIRKDFFDINYNQWHICRNFHLDKGIYNKDAEIFLYHRLWGIVYDSVFLLRRLSPGLSLKESYNYLKKILEIAEIGEKQFVESGFFCSSWLRTLILRRSAWLLLFVVLWKKQ